MERPFEHLNRTGPAYEVTASDDGLLVIRSPGHEDAFNALARALIEKAGDAFAVFPTPDGRAGYERLFVIPF